jgi:hypothetical protein
MGTVLRNASFMILSLCKHLTVYSQNKRAMTLLGLIVQDHPHVLGLSLLEMYKHSGMTLTIDSHTHIHKDVHGPPLILPSGNTWTSPI